MDDFEEIMAGALELAERREVLCSKPPHCPDCGAKQVQLVGWLEAPALWRCRECGWRWEYEELTC